MKVLKLFKNKMYKLMLFTDTTLWKYQNSEAKSFLFSVGLKHQSMKRATFQLLYPGVHIWIRYTTFATEHLIFKWPIIVKCVTDSCTELNVSSQVQVQVLPIQTVGGTNMKTKKLSEDFKKQVWKVLKIKTTGGTDYRKTKANISRWWHK